MFHSIPRFLRAHWISLLILLFINAIVLANSLLHHPKIGYDVTNHLNIIQVMPGRLATLADSSEYFSAPLAYFVPSLFDKVCAANQWGTCRWWDGKVAQILNFLLSVGLTVLLWKLASLLKPGSEFFRVALLSMLAVLTVYYKTFSQARGEPYVAFFTVLVVYLFARLVLRLPSAGWRAGLGLGAACGLLVLSRQWGFFIFPAFGVALLLVFLGDRALGWRLLKILATAGLAAFVVGGWFYLHLYFSYGTFTAFNSQERGFSIHNQPNKFYKPTPLFKPILFDSPIHSNGDAFNNRFFPLFYTETWGDYFCYFTCVEPNEFIQVPANDDLIGPYLGRVNRVSIYPSLLLAASLAWGALQCVPLLRKGAVSKGFEPNPPAPFPCREGGENQEMGSFGSKMLPKLPISSISPPLLGERPGVGLLLRQTPLLNVFLATAVVSSLAGFLWFLISYPNGTAIKATYMIQAFVILPLLFAGLADRLYRFSPWVTRILLILLWLVIFHNLPAMITHFNTLTNAWRF